LIVATAAERRALRTPVVGLLRQVPSPAAGWRADLVDLIIVALAAVGIYQAWADRDAATATPLALRHPACLRWCWGCWWPGSCRDRGQGGCGAAPGGPDRPRTGRPGHRSPARGPAACSPCSSSPWQLLCTATLGWQASAAAAQNRARQSLAPTAC
jgi:hypothetical protein